MSNSKLFAFHMASPLSSHDEIENADYDPQTQTTAWQGQTRSQALYCTWAIYGVDCWNINGACGMDTDLKWFAYQCDGTS